ncbi:type VI secretion system ATPase TssH [Thaumasiovibrio subtropicus]|uniref:type VI secretion system ATPase TssH n=1 Tax=Thaumasiovibrio subtropicus TaxID=1891207 RepID=UPI000B34BA8A|nr:type VI secretion system ATPase TssH [Thaumasiovibrio subtropicus]
MSTLPLKAIVEKLTPQARLSLEKAAACASSRSHFSVDVGHWLFELSNSHSTDFISIARLFNIDEGAWCSDLTRYLERQKTGSSEVPGLSANIVDLLSNAWMSATIAFNETQIDVVHVLFTLVNDDGGLLIPSQYTAELNKIDPQALQQRWQEGLGEGVQTGAPAPQSKHTPALDQYTIDLTEQARNGKLDPVVGRDNEIRLMIDILMRRRQNNPILTGEAGVGKTAVVEGLALKIATGDVPDSLKGVAIKSLDLALLQAGAGVKGEFENRLKSVVSEVKASATPIIIFIDEAHGLIGNGNDAGDAANILKPALARGELRTIAATTWAEYKKHIEKDAALTRRFQLVQIDEPNVEGAIDMLRGLVNMMEAHHGVRVTAKALEAAVKLSDRYIHGRQLPDKAVSLLDTACSRVALSQSVIPARLDMLDKKMDAFRAAQDQLMRDAQLGEENQQALAEIEAKLAELGDERATLQQQWDSESESVESVLSLQKQLLTDDESLDRDALKGQLAEAKTGLEAAEQPMIFTCVNENLVAEIISDWTGIPVGRMQTDEIAGLLQLQSRLCERVIGQDHGLKIIAEVVQTARAGLNDEKKPNGVFFLTGPSGVGKTESALALAEEVYGSEDNITVINMSEFKEEHKVSLLLGSPPGYIGYGEGGVLTEAVRRKPYSVILLDEMEKAHPGVQDVFYQVFDKGTIKDGEGRDIDFRNTIIIMTSNAGTDTTMELCADPDLMPTPEALREALRDDLLQSFKPAFLGRLNIIPYLPLNDDVLSSIIDLQIARVEKRLKSNYSAALNLTSSVKEYILSRCNETDSGARVIQNLLQNEILPQISEKVLSAMAERISFTEVLLEIENDICQVKLK